MNYKPKNYRTDGGNTTVIGGKLKFTDEAEVENFPGGGGSTFTPAANIPASTATELSELVTAFNTLLSNLKTAGLMAADE